MRAVLKRLENIRQSYRLPAPEYDVLTATERAAEAISHGAVEPWKAFWERIKGQPVAALRWRDQSYLIRQGWLRSEAKELMAEVADFCRTTTRTSPKTALIEAYLLHFPTDHAHFQGMHEACADIASMPKSPWNQPGTKYSLWDPEFGPQKVASLLGAEDDFKAVFIDARLRGDLQRGGFAERAVVEWSAAYRGYDADRLEEVGRRLIKLLKSDRFIELRGLIVFSLLLPWTEHRASTRYKSELTSALVTYGDPREGGPEWDSIKTRAKAYFSEEEIEAGLRTLSRWLGEASVREFFAIIRQSAGNTEHWRSREKFWSSYLDADLIDGAWFALGPIAQAIVKTSPHLKKGKFARLERGSASNEQSTLIMEIGGATIAEWSDNGACRFWQQSDPNAPVLYKSKYQSTKLRTTHGGDGFTYIAHQGQWQIKFARQIRQMTGIGKPR